VFQDVCEHIFGYKVLAAIRVRDFEYEGRKVYSHAPEDMYVKVMMKTLA
jgi:hypothetical protein